MSNIYDALTKQKGEAGRKSGGAALPPAVGAGRAGLPTLLDVSRDRELEALRQRVILELGAERTAALVFTGAVPGEGSSTIALLFARRLAEAEGRPVLLVDGDFSRTGRSLSGALGGPAGGGAGLAEVLLGSAALDSVVLTTEEPNLHFLPCGSVSGPNVELVRGDRIQPVLEEMRRRYAFVIFDSASTLSAPETGPLAAATDGVVLVVRANRSRREIVQKAVLLLGKARCRMLGVVLNDRRYPIPAFIYRRI